MISSLKTAVMLHIDFIAKSKILKKFHVSSLFKVNTIRYLSLYLDILQHIQNVFLRNDMDILILQIIAGYGHYHTLTTPLLQFNMYITRDAAKAHYN